MLVHLKKTELFETVIPSKIFEAMATERPLIMGVQGDSAKIVEQSGSGVGIESENDQQLFDALTSLCDNEAQYERLCQSGREFVSQYYSRDTLASDFLKIAEAVASGKRVQSQQRHEN